MFAYIDIFTVFLAAVLATVFFGLYFTAPFAKKYFPEYRFKHSFLFFPPLLLSAYIMALLQQFFHVTSFWDGIISGLFLWLGILFPFRTLSFFIRKSPWPVFLWEEIAFLAAILLMSGILAG